MRRLPSLLMAYVLDRDLRGQDTCGLRSIHPSSLSLCISYLLTYIFIYLYIFFYILRIS